MSKWSILGKFGLTKLVLSFGLILAIGLVLSLNLGTPSTLAATQTSSHSVNVSATVYGPPPSTPAVITTPVDGSISMVTPIVVSGTCGPGLTVKLFINNVLAGTTTCSIGGTFTINTTLNAGKNKLTVLNYDTLGQAGPASPTVTVTVPVASSSEGSPTGTGSSPTTQQPGTPGLPTGNGEPEPGSNSSAGGSRTVTLVHTEILAWLVTSALLIGMFLLLRRRRRK